MRRAVVVLWAMAAAGVVALAATPTDAYGQRGGRAEWRDWFCHAPECPQAAYDGRFTLARAYFDARGGGFGFRGSSEPAWHHDRPFAERNLSSILREISFVQTFDGAHGGNVFMLDDPELFRYPVLWFVEPGFWRPGESEIEALRAYMLKGGFVIFDDFRSSHWFNFEAQMRRVLPELHPIRMDGSEPIFHSFFSIDMAALNVQQYAETPEYWGIFEDNDRTKRQIAMINYNNDIGESMDYNPTGFVPVDVGRNDAYKLGVNYIVYALTH